MHPCAYGACAREPHNFISVFALYSHYRIKLPLCENRHFSGQQNKLLKFLFQNHLCI